ncbi:hypothetical protein KCU93_g143, partial [Aureobasidium melanogenum]
MSVDRSGTINLSQSSFHLGKLETHVFRFAVWQCSDSSLKLNMSKRSSSETARVARSWPYIRYSTLANFGGHPSTACSKRSHALVHLASLVQGADGFDKINSFIEVINCASFGCLSGLCHNINGAIEVLVAQLHLCPFDPHLSESVYGLERYLDGLFHNDPGIA